MKLKYEFETVNIDGKVMAVPVGENSADANMMVRLNDSASFIFNLLKEDTTTEKIVDKILAEYDGNRDEIKNTVDEFIAELKEKNIIE